MDKISDSDLVSHLENGVVTTFLQQTEKVPRGNDSNCIRFLRKKYHCLIIYSLLIIVFLQSFTTIVSKFDDNTFNLMFKSLSDFVNNTNTISTNVV